MKRLFALVALALSALSWSVFDLQKVNRFNSSAISDSSMRLLVLKGDGGFIAVGRAHQDIVLLDFDAFGGILRQGLWDSPLVQSDNPVFVGRYADGRILLGATHGSFTTLVQFSANLAVNWEVQRPVATGQVALDGSGNAYLGSNQGLESFSASGISQGVANMTDFQLGAMAGIPGATNPGVYVVGRNTNLGQPRALRFTAAATVGFDRTDVLSIGATGSRYLCLDVEDDMDVVIGGRVGSTGSTVAFFTKLNGAGNGDSAQSASGAEVARLKIQDATGAYALFGSSANGRIGFLNRTNLTVGAVSAVEPNGHSDFAVLSGASKVVASTFDGADILNSSTLAHISNSFFGNYTRMYTLDSQLAVGIGEQDGAAVVNYLDGDGLNGFMQFKFVGYPTRTFLQSGGLPDGSVAMISREVGAGEPRLVAVRYNPAGALLYARTFGFANQTIPQSDAGFTTFPDGSIAYAQRLNANTWGFAKISSSGVVKSAVFPYFSSNLQPAQIVPLSDGSSAVFSLHEGDFLRYTRVSNNAAILQEHTYVDQASYDNTSIARPVVLPNGNIAVAARMDNGTVTFRAINPNTGAAGAVQTLGTNCNSIRVTLDSSNNLLLAFDDGGVLNLVRRNSANLAQTMNSATSGTSQGVVDLVPQSGFHFMVLNRQTGDDDVGLFTNGFAHVETGTLPATVTNPRDLAVGPGDISYVTAEEVVNGTTNVYSARYLQNGIRSAQRRTAGRRGGGIFAGATGVWVTGEVGTRKKGVGPFAARYSL